MSSGTWRAALIGRRALTVWTLTGTQVSARSDDLSPDALTDLPGPVVVAGLSGATRSVPCRPLGPTTHVSGQPHLAAIPMIGQSSPPARSNGAETAIAGYLAQDPEFDGVLLVLSEETSWAHISASEVVSFQTFLTPELATALDAEMPHPDAAFDQALDMSLSRPEKLAQHLASARAAGTGQEYAHLIGAEIAAAKPYWLGQKVVVLGAQDAASLYLAALAKQGVAASQSDLETALLAGFRAAWSEVAGQGSSFKD